MRKAIFPLITAVLLVLSAASGFILSGYTDRVLGESMEPTLYSYDIVYGAKNPPLHDIHHLDIIVFKDEYQWSGKPELLVKRVMGLPGDTVVISPAGTISVNGKAMERDALYHAGCPLYNRATATIRIPKGKIFVRGDNVNESNDSRYAYCARGTNYLVDANRISLREHGIIPIGRTIRR